jgi:hypothetical protein
VRRNWPRPTPDARGSRSERRVRQAASKLLIAAALAASISPALAQWRDWDSDFDEDRKPWKEIEARIPSYPRTGDLVPFEAGAESPHRFYVDARSLSVGEDGVVRYTLVIKAAGGATNVTFEGIRCELRLHKYYAVGRADGNWVRARNPQWRRIEQQHINRHHNVLYSDFLCSGKQPATSVREVLRLLRYGPPAGE